MLIQMNFCMPMSVTHWSMCAPNGEPGEVADWLISVISHPLDITNSKTNISKQAFESLEFSVASSSARRTLLPDQMIHVPRKLKAQNLEIVWSDDAWICTKQLQHYPTF